MNNYMLKSEYATRFLLAPKVASSELVALIEKGTNVKVLEVQTVTDKHGITELKEIGEILWATVKDIKGNQITAQVIVPSGGGLITFERNCVLDIN